MTSDNILENVYCPEQIPIPITFPSILKVYTKAAIRTQPYDLLKWTAAYFRALANKEVPPVKERLEYPPLVHSSGMTLGYLKTLLNRFGKVNKVPLRMILEHWQGIDLREETLYQICLIGNFLEGDRNCDFYPFLAIACGFLANNLTETMIYVCELLTGEPKGGSAMIHLSTFLNLYGYLANLDCSGKYPPVDMKKQDEDKILQPEVDQDSICVSLSHLRLCEDSDSISQEIIASFRESIREEEESLLCVEVEDEEEKGDEKNDEEKKDEIDVESNFYYEEKKNDQLSGSQIKITSKLETIDRLVNENDDREKEENEVDKEEEEEEDNLENAETIEEENDRRVELDYDEVRDRISYEDERNDLNFDEEYIGTGGEGREEEGEEPWYHHQMEAYSGEFVDPLIDVCTCLEQEVEDIPTPPPVPCDPLEEFVKRMETKIEKVPRKERIFLINGIGGIVSEEQVMAVGIWLTDCARRQEGFVGPRNIKHFLCPDLEDPNSDCQCR